MAASTTHRVAAAHFAPIPGDVEATAQKAARLIASGAEQGIEFLAFSELFLSGFPYWIRLLPPNQSDAAYREYLSRAIAVDDDAIAVIRKATRDADIVVSIGFAERSPRSVGIVWNANLIIDTQGDIQVHHRKLVPTFAEKLVFTSGDGAGLRCLETRVGCIGALICGENTNPLARYALIAQGEDIHVASYPAVVPAKTTSGAGYNLRDSIRIRAANHSIEGKVHTIVSSCPMTAALLDDVTRYVPDSHELFVNGSHAVSMITSPSGAVVSETAGDKEEAFCVADIDSSAGVVPKRMHDIAGSYNRFDVFDLRVNFDREEALRAKSTGWRQT